MHNEELHNLRWSMKEVEVGEPYSSHGRENKCTTNVFLGGTRKKALERR
jgi:hypothetical protein